MPKYTVKIVKEGPDKGKWGVYRGGTLMMPFKRHVDAVKDAKLKNQAEGSE